MSEYQKGDKVWIINQTMSGTYFLEGEAEISSTPEGHAAGRPGYYWVDFHDGMSGTVERFVDPKAQEDPAHYVADLNAA